MEEVRSYWQVASIQHFCTLFQKPFKLPSFEPEELEQAFVIDVPEPPKSISSCFNSIVNNHNNDVNNDTNSDEQKQNGDDGDNENGDEDDGDQQPKVDSRRSSPDYLPPSETRTLTQQPPQQQQQNEDQQELHLLVKLAIALLKPHFNSKIRHPDVLIPSSANWENYLRRLIDVHWVELEKCPSPLSIPIITPDGIELPKSLSFRELPLSDKIDIFSALCDYRLWCEDVSELLKDYPMDELRLESIGKDSHGYEYWYFSGTRLFKENIELSQDLICRKKRIKELEYKLIELEKARILKEQEDKKKAELERAKQLANEAREARLAAKRQHQQPETAASSSASKRKRGSNTPILPPRTGLRERRSSAAANNNDPPATPSRTLRSRAKPAEQQAEEVATPQNAPKTTRGSAKQSKQAASRDRSQATTPEAPKKSPEEECREELEEKLIKQDERHQAWSIECESLEEWESFVKKFDKTKSTNERYLSAHLTNVLLPHIQGIYAKRAAEIRRKEKELLLSLATRRVSTRITSKRAQEEEEERQAQLREAEIQKKKAEAEIRLRAELEKEIRAKQNRFVVNGGTSSACSEDGDDSAGRYNLRQNQHHAPEVTSEFDGIIHPDKLAEFYEALELIIDTVRTSKHAWPFVDAVPDTVPGYYDLIKRPMDLKTLRTKVEFRQYKSLIEVEKDFQLLVNNCEKYNGPKNVYTKMVYKLWKSFRKNVQFYLERDLHMNEYETFLHPPVFPTQTTDQPASNEPSSTNDLTQTNTMTQNGNGNRSPPDHKDNYSQQQLDTYKIKRSPTSNGNDANDYTDGDVFETKVNMKTEAKPLATPNVFAQTNNSPKMGVSSVTQHSNCHDSVPLEFKPELNLQFQPTPIEVPVEIIEEGLEFPPEPVCEEVIIESYAEPCSDNASVILKQEH